MKKLELIEALLRKTALRRRWQRAGNGWWIGFLWGAGVWALLLSLDKVLPLPELTLAIGGALWAILMLIGWVWGWWRRETPLEVARWVDLQKDFQEQVSTALEFSQKDASRWRDLLLEQAAERIQGSDLQKLVIFHLPKAAVWALIVLAIGAGLGFVPEYRTQGYWQKQREKEALREAGQHLVMISRRSLETRPAALEETRKSLESVEELGRELTKAKLTRSDALKNVASVTDKLKEEMKQFSANPVLKNMERAARNPGDSSNPAGSDAQKQLESLEKAAGKQGKESALEKLGEQLKKAEAAAAGMKNSSGADQAQKEALSAALSSLSRNSEQLGLKLPGLQEAMEALAAAKFDQVLKELEVADQSLDELKALARKLDGLQPQSEKPGKDLSEQLEKGQAEMAQSRLLKLAQQLHSRSLSSEEMKKILDEVSRALAPSKDYGKVAEHLQAGVGQMQAGDKKGAAESLQAAAKELAKLLEQAQEAEMLASSLEALQKAEMCIGTCQGWGMCQGPGRVGSRSGKKPGYGVGTWADDNLWLDNPQNELWDNSGIQRPDQAARGATDRGDGKAPDSLIPTKIKGKITPGGPMPSITLKGLNLKGTSKVAVQEMVESAQSEAQSALSQEKVPRAYQSAVREYFDELKQ